MRPRDIPEERAFRLVASLTGMILGAAALVAADLARGHMALVGAVCGVAAQPHCGWCVTAAGLTLAALSAVVIAVRPQRAAVLSRDPH